MALLRRAVALSLLLLGVASLALGKGPFIARHPADRGDRPGRGGVHRGSPLRGGGWRGDRGPHGDRLTRRRADEQGPDREGHPGQPDPGAHLGDASGWPGGLGRHLRDPCRRRRGHGPEHDHRRRLGGRGGRRRAAGDDRPQDHQRPGRPDPAAGRRSRAERRLGRIGRARRGERRRRGGRRDESAGGRPGRRHLRRVAGRVRQRRSRRRLPLPPQRRSVAAAGGASRSATCR